MKEADAEKINILMLQINAQMNDSIVFVRDKGSEAEFVDYRAKAAQVMADVIDILNDLYKIIPR